MAATPATDGRTPKLTYTFSYYHRSKGTSLPRWRRGTVHRREILRSLAKLEEAQVVPPFHTPTTTSSQPEGTTTLPSLQPILIDDNGTPATWTLVLFQQAIDRKDRTPAEGRFSYWNYRRYTLHRNPPTTGQGLVAPTTCLVGHHSIEATTTPATGTMRPSRKPTPRRRQTSHRAPLDTNTLTPTSVQDTPPLLSTGHPR